MSIPEPPGELQFERAEKGDEAPQQLLCAVCSTEIASSYYERGGQIVCPACHDRLLAARERGSGSTRFGRATLFGLAAAVAGALLWWGVSELTGLQLSLIAIVIGYLVGNAVRFGSYGRGGWAYQALAIVLTYTSIVSAYVPSILEAMRQPPSVEMAVTVSSPDSSPPAAPEPGGAEVEAAPAEPPADLPAEEEPPLPRPVRLLSGILAVLLIAFAAPFLSGFSNFIGWIILAIGLYEAWKLNRKEGVVFEGPFRIGETHRSAGSPPTPPAPLPPVPPPIAP